jgi:hypothetical protein
MNARRRIQVLSSASLLLVTVATTAQAAPRPVDPFTLGAGDQVRLWDTAGSYVGRHGGVVASDHTGLSVVIRGDAEVVPFASLTRLEVRRGRRHYERGAWIGAAAALLTYVIVKEDRHETGDPWRALAWTAAGAAAGAGAGAFVKGPHWHPVPLDGFRPAPPAPPPVALRLRF